MCSCLLSVSQASVSPHSAKAFSAALDTESVWRSLEYDATEDELTVVLPSESRGYV